MSALPVVTNPVRLYRAVRERQHDLSIYLKHADVYGKDVWAHVIERPSDMYFIPPPMATTVAEQPILLRFPSGTWIDVGWLVEVKRAVYYDGRLIAVETQLVSPAPIGATKLYVASTIGFISGLPIFVGRSEFCTIQSINAAEKNLLLCEDTPLMATYTAETPISCCTFYKVVSVEPSEIVSAWAVRTHPEVSE